MDLLIEWIGFLVVFLFILKIMGGIFGPKSSPPERAKAVKSSPPERAKAVKSSPPERAKAVKSSVPKNYTENPSANFLQSCIDGNKIISFTYIDNDGVITERSVTPKRIFWGYSNREGGDKKIRTCWLESYCHMRKEDRTFIKDKISNVTLANESSVSDQGNRRRYSLDGVSLKELHFDLQAGKVSKQDALTAVELKLKRTNMRDLSRKRWTRERDRLAESILSNTNNNKVESKSNLLKEAYAKTRRNRRR